ncbi:Hypothetical predicted protein [Xyrichtys novacula]|uniref:Uncharacterized protein n=1 Tax=Xyrichtys novacula TaxID=13765 RepID=A0AAV1FBY3_XYRNO|nr:Hypothetical predicted protein [Xyrichtys novacula]
MQNQSPHLSHFLSPTPDLPLIFTSIVPLILSSYVQSFTYNSLLKSCHSSSEEILSVSDLSHTLGRDQSVLMMPFGGMTGFACFFFTCQSFMTDKTFSVLEGSLGLASQASSPRALNVLMTTFTEENRA